mgnify:CR=1 FL=1
MLPATQCWLLGNFERAVGIDRFPSTKDKHWRCFQTKIACRGALLLGFVWSTSLWIEQLNMLISQRATPSPPAILPLAGEGGRRARSATAVARITIFNCRVGMGRWLISCRSVRELFSQPPLPRSLSHEGRGRKNNSFVTPSSAHFSSTSASAPVHTLPRVNRNQISPAHPSQPAHRSRRW